MDVVERLFALIAEQGLEQKQFAQKINIVPQTITDWKNGKSKSYTKRIPQIADVLGTTTEYLLTGTGAKYKSPSVSESDTKKNQAAIPKDSSLVDEFTRLFSELTPENQNVIIAEMLRRRREG